VFFFLETVVGNEKPADAGELRSSGHGATVPELATSGRQPPGCPWWPGDRPRPSEDQGPRLKHTPLQGKIVKEPLEFLLFNPPSFTYFKVYVYLFRKRILVG